MGVEVQTSKTSEIENGVCLHAESAAEVVVAVYHVVVVAERTAKQYSAEEDALFET